MKYKRWLVLALALCMALPLAACGLKPAAPWPEVLKPGGRVVRGSGELLGWRIPLEENEQGYALRITGITLQGGGDVELVIDESLAREVMLTTDENIAEYISVDYDADKIVIDRKERVILTPTKLSIAVGAPVRELEINGAWKFTYDCPGVMDCAVDINGAANGNFTFGELDTLRVELNGTGNITLAGAAKAADLTINGAANIKGFDLIAEAASAFINGAGNCEITATETLDAEINGLGKVVYGGEPAVSKRIQGLGEVRAK